MRKKFVVKNHRKRHLVLITGLVLFVFLGIGYATLSTSLTFDGSMRVIAPSTKLYDVLKDEASNGTYAREYTGSHHDSYVEEPSKSIYHWYTETSTGRNAIKNKNNVIFANHCWKMIRTTDTGGVKLLYNGVAENNQCLDTRSNHVGISGLSSAMVNGTKWYGTDYTYDSTTNEFSLSGEKQYLTWSYPDVSNILGKYTCLSTDENATCSILYLIYAPSTVSAYYNVYAQAFSIRSTVNYSIIGSSSFNGINNDATTADSPAYVGYMYNDVYSAKTQKITTAYTENVITYSNFSTWYYYADSVNYDSSTGKYTLVNPSTVSSSNSSSLVGKYTFNSSSSSTSNATVYYIASIVGGNQFWEYALQNNNSISSCIHNYSYGSSYTDNHNGTYTINNATTFESKDWNSHMNAVKGKYVCKDATNDTCSTIMFVNSTSNNTFTYVDSNTHYKFGSSFTYENGAYHLVNPVDLWGVYQDTVPHNISAVDNAHYTCLNDSGECSSIYYIYLIQKTGIFYITLENGKSIEDALDDMLFGNNVNTKDSTIKYVIDLWFSRYLNDYSDYLEDTVFCNNRSISNYSGWVPNGSVSSVESLKFREYNDYLTSYYALTGDLSCENNNDKFSIYNNTARLTYKVGLMTAPEMTMIGGNKYIYESSSGMDDGWLMSPHMFSNTMSSNRYIQTGSISKASYMSGKVRPVVSLIPNIKYTSGDGSLESPYIVHAPLYTLTIYYRNGITGDPITDNYVGHYTPGSSYSVTSPTIEGFIPSSPVVSGTLSQDNYEVVVNYYSSTG